MAIHQATATTFAQLVTRPGIVVVDWWAPWCAPCRAFAPIFEDAAGRYPDVVFAAIDTDAQAGLAAACGIEVIPTLTVFRDGKLLITRQGGLSADVLARLIHDARGALAATA